MNSMKVKRGDTVMVITGKSGKEGIKGKTGRVLSADPKAGTVIVDGLRMQKKHTKAKNAKSTGGIISQPGPIDSSNVMVVCPTCGKATRVGYSINEKGEKARVCKKKTADGKVCGAVLDKGYKAERKAKKVEDAKPEKKEKKAKPAAEKTADAKPAKAKKEKTEKAE